MANHPIEGLMDTIMTNIKTMVDVNTVVGTPVTGPDGTLIIPVSTVSYGFGVGGSEFEKKNPGNAGSEPLFGGGYGGGANVKPIAFLVVSNGNIKLLPVTPETSPVNKIIDMVPEVIDKVNCAVSAVADKMKEKKSDCKCDCNVDVVD
ncbi:MAG: GerW family sporulation protein [Clostridia bacterium]|nr:GerW family sporulation protein [Clostridia bacterium]